MSEPIDSPYRLCQNRYFLCHSDCTSYKKYKSKLKEIKEGRANFFAERTVAVESVYRQKKHKNH
jgi:hypothetical protein